MIRTTSPRDGLAVPSGGGLPPVSEWVGAVFEFVSTLYIYSCMYMLRCNGLDSLFPCFLVFPLANPSHIANVFLSSTEVLFCTFNNEWNIKKMQD